MGLHAGERLAGKARERNQGSKLRLEPREPDEVRAETEARALAGREADARGKEIKEGERDRRDNRNREDLLDIELLLRDDERRKGDRETLKEVLDSACYELCNSETVHTYNQGPENLCIGHSCGLPRD